MKYVKSELISKLFAIMYDEDGNINRRLQAAKTLLKYDKEKVIEFLESLVEEDSFYSPLAIKELLSVLDKKEEERGGFGLNLDEG